MFAATTSVMQAQSTLAGSSALVANLTRPLLIDATVFAGGGTVTTVAQLAYAAGAKLSGASALTGSTNYLLAAYLALGGSGVLNALVTSMVAGAAQTLGSGQLAALAHALLATSVTLTASGVLTVNAILKVLTVPGVITVTDSVQFQVGVSDQPASKVMISDGVS